MKKNISFCILCFFAICFSQKNENYFDESLQKQRDSILKIITNDSKLGLEAAEKFRVTCQKKENFFYEAGAMGLIDISYANMNDYKNLLKSTDQSIAFCKEHHFYDQEFRASTRKARALMFLGLLPEAKKILDDNRLLIDKIEPTDPGLELIGNFWNNYGQFYDVQNNQPEATKMLNKAFSSYQKIQHNMIRTNLLIQGYANIGALYMNYKKVDSAFIFYKKAENLFPLTDNHNLRLEAMIVGGYGMGYNMKKKYKEAVPFLMKSLEMSKKNNYEDIYIESLRQLSESYKHIENKNDPYYKKYRIAEKEFNDKNTLTAKEFEKIKTQNTSFYDRNKYSIWSASGVLLIGFLGITVHQSKKRKKVEEEKTDISEVVKEQSEEISILKTKVNDAFEKILELAKKNDPTFLKRFSEVYPEFFTKLTSQYEELTNTQLRVIAFSFLNFNTKDIATIMNTSVRTTQTHKYRIRKVINIDPEEDLINWTQTLVG